MPLAPVQTTEVAAANQVAQRIIQDIVQKATQIAAIRSNGIPEVPAQSERTAPNGQVIPARPSTPAVSAAAINAALGKENCATLDALAAAIG